MVRICGEGEARQLLVAAPLSSACHMRASPLQAPASSIPIRAQPPPPNHPSHALRAAARRSPGPDTGRQEALEQCPIRTPSATCQTPYPTGLAPPPVQQTPHRVRTGSRKAGREGQGRWGTEARSPRVRPFPGLPS
eukprot:CAMPEP_0174918500 /NCGR_PEP_ID=MMETSP1355-20121228/3108_1 /TAXON_ID=464990 /ORGANISM="Hemiselmis tepida, Strain CCMP443" /LENGTH=135 /DNA_ID=CAMNT_0016163675 /DNA_START=40 /DNA_END=447 /DNA_ORIENTATION=-